LGLLPITTAVLLAVDTHSTAYHVGQVAGLVVVIGLAAIVIRRALTRGFGRPAAPANSPPADSNFTGLLVGSASTPPTPLEPMPGPSGTGLGARNLLIVAVAVILAAAFVASSISRGLLDSGSAGPWSTSEGANLKAGFIAGCGKGITSRTQTCECVFTRLSSIPPYNTIGGFEQLEAELHAFEQTRDRSRLPVALLSSVRSCSSS
jgi:hypothetical protein